MATIVANPYYDDPFLSSIASNISRAFIDRNPGQTAAGRAHARLYGLQADELESKRGARTKIAEQFRQLNGRSPTPAEYGVMTGDTIEGGIKPGDIADSNLFYQSNSGQSPSLVARAVVGTGKTIGKGEGVTLEDRNEIIARDEANKRQVANIGAGPGYARVAEDTRNNKANLDFKEKTRWDAPVKVGDGDALYFNTEDTRFQGVTPGYIPAPKADKKIAGYDNDGQPIYIDASTANGQRRPPTATEVEKTTKAATPIAGYDADGNPIYLAPGEAPGQRRPPTATEVEKGRKFPPTPDASSPTGWSQRVGDENVPVAKPATAVEKPPRPGDINSPKEVSDAEWNILSKLGAVGSDGSIDRDFIAEFGDKMPGALAAIGAPGTSAGSAESTYLKALGIEPGSTWARGGWFSKPQLNKPKSKIGAAITSGGPAPAGKQQAAPQQAAPKVAPAEALSQARAAIAQGKPRDLVIQRLQQLGISPEGL